MARAKAVERESYAYTVVFEPDEEAGGYTVTCPALPGLVTEGDTLEQARERAAGAIRCSLESPRRCMHAKRLGRPQNPYFSFRKLKAASPPSMMLLIASRVSRISIAPSPAIFPRD